MQDFATAPELELTPMTPEEMGTGLTCSSLSVNQLNWIFQRLFAGAGAVVPELTALQFTQSGVGAVLRNVQDKLGETVSICDYGALPGLPSSDGGAALQKAIDHLAARSGGRVEIVNYGLPYYWLTTPTFPPSTDKWIEIVGVGRPTILFTATGYRFLDPDRTADYQTFGNLRITNFEIDADGKTGLDHLIFGGRKDGVWTLAQRINFADIDISDVACINVPMKPNPAIDAGPLAIALISMHPTTNEATQTSIQRVSVTNVSTDGGYSTALIAGIDLSGNHNSNVWLDQIWADRVRYLPPNQPLVFAGASGLMIGGDGYGGQGGARDCYSQNSGDNGFEVNAFDDFKYSNCVAKNCYNLGFYTTNYHAASQWQQQSVVYDKCAARCTAGALKMRGFGMSSANGNALGTVIYDKCGMSILNDAKLDYSARAVFMDYVSNPTNADVVIRNFTLDWHAAATSTTDAFPNAFLLRAAPGRTVSLDAKITLRGAIDLASTYNFSWRGADPFGAGRVNIEGLELVSTLTVNNVRSGGISPSCVVNIGEEQTAALSIGINGLRGSAVNKFTAIQFRSGVLSNANRALITNSDLSGFNYGASVDVAFSTATDAEFVRIQNTKRLTAPAAVTETVPASGTALTNRYSAPRTYYVSGGAVTAIEVQPVNGGAWATTGLTSGGITLDAGQSLRWTGTAAPVIRSVPMGNY